MAEPTDRCPKCDGTMERGFVSTEGRSHRMTTVWAAGPHRTSFWWPVILPSSGVIPVGTFRCASCGYLEAYAGHEFKAQ